MMPHHEHVFRNVQMSQAHQGPSGFSPWLHLWHNSRKWVD